MPFSCRLDDHVSNETERETEREIEREREGERKGEREREGGLCHMLMSNKAHQNLWTAGHLTDTICAIIGLAC